MSSVPTDRTPQDARTKGVPKVLSVRTDTGTLADDLATLLETGRTTSEATRWALGWAAHCLRHAWDQGVTPRGTIPDMRARYRAPRKPV